MAKRIVEAVDPGAARSLLDVGGGSGTYTMAFFGQSRKCSATLFDLPEVIEMARERLKNEGLLDRVTLVPGSFYLQEFPEGHDLALISAIIHSNSPEENLELYRKVFRALKPGGRILVRDHVMSPDRTWPRDGAVFAINMLVGTSGGGTYTYEEIEAGLREGRIRENQASEAGRAYGCRRRSFQAMTKPSQDFDIVSTIEAKSALLGIAPDGMHPR